MQDLHSLWPGGMFFSYRCCEKRLQPCNNNSLQQTDNAYGNRSDMSLDVLTFSFTAIVQMLAMLTVALKMYHYVSLQILHTNILDNRQNKNMFFSHYFMNLVILMHELELENEHKINAIFFFLISTAFLNCNSVSIMFMDRSHENIFFNNIYIFFTF